MDILNLQAEHILINWFAGSCPDLVSFICACYYKSAWLVHVEVCHVGDFDILLYYLDCWFLLFLFSDEDSQSVLVFPSGKRRNVIQSEEGAILSQNNPIGWSLGNLLKLNGLLNFIPHNNLVKSDSKLNIIILNCSRNLIDNPKSAIIFIPRYTCYIFLELNNLSLYFPLKKINNINDWDGRIFFLNFLEWDWYPITFIRDCDVDFFYI